MIINKIQDGNKLTVTLEGRLDSNSAPQLDVELKTNLEDIKELVLDFAELVYLSSAGLRVILAAQKQMNKQGKMVIVKVNETIMDIFEISGFTEILTIEK
jgi:anti-anti-sigma factor